MRLLLFLFFNCAFVGLSQTTDSSMAVYFNQSGQGKTIIKKEGDKLSVNLNNGMFLETNYLLILSDSTVMMHGDTVLLADIATVSTRKKNRAPLGGVLTAVGGLSAGAGFLVARWAIQLIEDEPFAFIIALPVLVLGGGMLVGGIVTTTIGAVILISSINRDIAVTEKPEVKTHVETFY